MKVALTIFECKNYANLKRFFSIPHQTSFLLLVCTIVYVSKCLMWSSSHRDASINHCLYVNAFDKRLVGNLPIEEFENKTSRSHKRAAWCLNKRTQINRKCDFYR